ncbi:hypothetical protein DFH08DRAFT_805250 [Mycena albidolilacea]|uniref:Uncharacterized protein n=1 Tax=Mycena albidolilacea TaxID=1033008 RepID=A0AAD7A979_9AGAR|nr:hypothetical protein DFH08DRAFT_805250 [Mycena albidolilacea]
MASLYMGSLAIFSFKIVAVSCGGRATKGQSAGRFASTFPLAVSRIMWTSLGVISVRKESWSYLGIGISARMRGKGKHSGIGTYTMTLSTSTGIMVVMPVGDLHMKPIIGDNMTMGYK